MEKLNKNNSLQDLLELTGLSLMDVLLIIEKDIYFIMEKEKMIYRHSDKAKKYDILFFQINSLIDTYRR